MSAKKKPVAKPGLLESGAAALLLAGVFCLAWHPWGLCLLAVSGLLLLAARWQALGLGAGEASLKISGLAWRLGGLGMALALAGGVWLYVRFGQTILYPSDWHGVWFVAALALGLGLAASFAFPLKLRAMPARLPAQVPQAGWMQLAFWLACLQLMLGSGLDLMLGSLGLAAVLLFAPEAGPTIPGTRLSRLKAACLMVGIIGLGLHIWQLRDIPQGLNIEEYHTLDLARPVMEGKQQSVVVAATWFSGVIFYQHLVGWFYRFFPAQDILPLRLVTVLGWLVLALYSTLFTAELFSWAAALGTAAYFCLSFFAMHYGRFGFYFIWAPAVGAAALAHAAWGLRRRWGGFHFFLSGCYCALAAYGWIAGFIVPGLVVAYVAAELGWDAKRWRPRLPSLALGLVGALVLAAPAIQLHLHFPGGIQSLFSSSQTSGSIFSDPGSQAPDLSSNLLLQFKEMLMSGTQSAEHYLPGLPLFPKGILFFMAAGFGLLWRRPWQPRSLVVLAACFLGFLPAWISDPAGRNFGRLIMLLLPAGILFGLGWSALWRACEGQLPKGSKAAAAWLAALALCLALGWEPIYYFRDYRSNRAAIKANFGPAAYMARKVSADLAPGEQLYFSESFDEANSLLALLPHGAQANPFRDATDLLELLSTSPRATLVASPLREDWMPWLESLSAGVQLTEIQNPWGVDYIQNYLDLKGMGAGNVMSVELRWKAIFPEAGLVKTGPERWEGTLWPPRADDYRLSIRYGRLLLAGKFRVPAGPAKLFQLQAVPYRVLVEGTPLDPELSLVIPRDADKEEWERPVFHGLSLHGLRKTLRPADSKDREPRMVSLAPVISQRFDLWSYEPYESLVGLPMRGDWEGTLRVPVTGSYAFTVPNTINGKLELSIGPSVYFRTLDKEPDWQRPALLQAGRAYPVHILAERIRSASALRFLVSGPGMSKQPVPSSWLEPSPLPDPVPKLSP